MGNLGIKEEIRFIGSLRLHFLGEKVHRRNGPAVIYQNGSKKWFILGEYNHPIMFDKNKIDIKK